MMTRQFTAPMPDVRRRVRNWPGVQRSMFTETRRHARGGQRGRLHGRFAQRRHAINLEAREPDGRTIRRERVLLFQSHMPARAGPSEPLWLRIVTGIAAAIGCACELAFVYAVYSV